MIIPRRCHITVPFGFIPWQLNNLTLHVPHFPQYAPFRTEMHTFLFWMMYYGIWDVYYGICENCLFIISSGIAWCHYSTSLYLASDCHRRMPNKFEWNPTTLKFSSRGWEEGGSEASSSSAPPFLGRTGWLTSPSDKIYCRKTFSVSNPFKPNGHPPTLTKIRQL